MRIKTQTNPEKVNYSKFEGQGMTFGNTDSVFFLLFTSPYCFSEEKKLEDQRRVFETPQNNGCGSLVMNFFPVSMSRLRNHSEMFEKQTSSFEILEL